MVPNVLARIWAVPTVIKVAAVLPLALAMAVMGWEPAAAAAVNRGPCQYFLNGAPSSLYNTPDHALRLAKNQSLTVAGSAPSRFRRYEVDLQYAMFSFKVAEGNPDGDTFSTLVEVATYAKYGAGTYKVVSNADTAAVDVFKDSGSYCAADAYIFVANNPLETAAGIGAGVAGAAGAAGVAAGAGGTGNENGGTTDEWEKEHQTDRPALPENPEVDDTDDGAGNDLTELQQVMKLGCFHAIIPMGIFTAVAALGVHWALGLLGIG